MVIMIVPAVAGGGSVVDGVCVGDVTFAVALVFFWW
jgi:hypothetical protein